MKKSLFFVPMLAVIVLATSCIKNEESDSVKQIRLAQASKLEAEASAMTTAAQAEATVAAAQAALLQAQAGYQSAMAAVEEAQAAAQEEETRHEAAMNALQEELQAASTDAQKASIEQQMERAEAQHTLDMANIESQAQINAAYQEQQLLDAQRALDAAQKQYEVYMAQAEIDHANTMADIEEQVQADLLADYQSSWDQWYSQSWTVFYLKQSIQDEKDNLVMCEESDSIVVANILDGAQQDVENAQEQVDNLEVDLANAQSAVANTDGIDAIVDKYETELETLKADSQSLYIELAIKRDTYNSAIYALNEASTKYSEASSEYYTANSNVDGLYYQLWQAERDTLNAYYLFNGVPGDGNFQSTYVDDVNNMYGWQHIFYDQATGYRMTDGYVSYANAVAAEEADVTSDGVFLSVADEADVDRAKTDSALVKAYYDAALTKYQTLYATWKVAADELPALKSAMDEANAVYESAREAYDLARPEYFNLRDEYTATYQRLIDVRNYIDYYTSYSYVASGNSKVEELESELEDAQEYLVRVQKNYDELAADINAGKTPYSSCIEYLNAQIEVDELNLAGEETKLELYKATLDDWSAQLQAALDEEN